MLLVKNTLNPRSKGNEDEVVLHSLFTVFQLDEEGGEEEQEDEFEISISVKDPEKIGEAYLFKFCFHLLYSSLLMQKAGHRSMHYPMGYKH